jgi:endonuclease-3
MHGPGGSSEEPSPRGERKRPFDEDAMFAAVAGAVEGRAPAAMFALREAGHASVFEQLVACILSIRTLDEVSLPVSLALLGEAPTPRALLALGPERVLAHIRRTTFAEAKVGQLLEIARRTEEEFGGALPADPAVLQSFRGVGPKCAHLALGVATGAPYISVDIHVHRVTNRWGYVAASTPERTLAALEARLPRRWWVDINRLLVPFGKHVCTGQRPRCSTCPVRPWCRQVGVTTHR